jgi:hypothetical protein
MEPEVMTETTEANDRFIAKRLRLAGALIIAGLAVEGVSLGWNHPLSFMAFIGFGGLLLVVGVLIYLISLITPAKS